MSDRLQNHNLEPFILPTSLPPPAGVVASAQPVLRLVSLGKVYPGLADGEVVLLEPAQRLPPDRPGEARCAPVRKQPQASDPRSYAGAQIHRLQPKWRRADHISLSKFQAGKKHLQGTNVSMSSNAAPVGGSAARAVGRHPGRSIRRYTGQAKMGFAGDRLRWIAYQLQDTPVGIGRQMSWFSASCKLPRPVVANMLTMTFPDAWLVDIGLGIGLAGRGAVSLKLVGIPQLPDSGSADRQVVGVQILQGAVRLGNDCLYLVLTEPPTWPVWRQYVPQDLGSCRPALSSLACIASAASAACSFVRRR